LAGGFHSNWQASVRQAVDAEWLDPSTHDLSDPRAYTAWDLQALRSCDVVFAYLERSNPGGYALALEVGYAAASSKPIILIDQHDDGSRARYFEMVRQVATFNCMSLADGIEALKRLIRERDVQTTAAQLP
jgi:nucleoside 2-deoxyribosyltransferase